MNKRIRMTTPACILSIVGVILLGTFLGVTLGKMLMPINATLAMTAEMVTSFLVSYVLTSHIILTWKRDKKDGDQS